MSSRREDALLILAMVSAAVAMGHVDPAQVVAALGDVVRGKVKPGAAPPLLPASTLAVRKPSGDVEVITRIFDRWKRTLDHPQARLTPDRVRVIKARMREGYTERQIMLAIEGCAASPYHIGENDSGTRYDDLTLICRSGSKLEAFVEKAGGGDIPAQTPEADARDERTARIREAMADAQKEGDVDRYERLNAKLARALQ